MRSEHRIILAFTIGFIILICAVMSYYLFFINSPNAASTSLNSSIMDSNGKALGSNDLGKVTIEGPYGNINSQNKIAFITGVHPLEANSHKALQSAIKNRDKSLNYCYYIYKVNVTKDPENYVKGRMNGQLLANQFAIPHIISQNYMLMVDIHSNEGNYKEKWFVFAPNEDKNSKTYALKIVNNVSGLVYYNPPSQTSPRYVTIPIQNSGKPAIVYETYLYDPYEVTMEHELKLLNSVDNL